MARVFTWILSLAGFAILGSSPAYACTCGQSPTAEAVDRARVVVLGVVSAMSVVDEGQPEPLIKIEVKVREALKNAAPNGVLTLYGHRFGLSCLGYDFRIARSYLIFAAPPWPGSDPRIRPDTYVATLCGGTTELGGRQGLAMLDEVRRAVSGKPTP